MKGGTIISLALIILCGLLFISTFKEKNKRNELPPIWIKGNIITKEENNFTIIVTDNDYCDFINKSEKIVINLNRLHSVEQKR